jgi:hypothetical protein
LWLLVLSMKAGQVDRLITWTHARRPVRATRAGRIARALCGAIARVLASMVSCVRGCDLIVTRQLDVQDSNTYI